MKKFADEPGAIDLGQVAKRGAMLKLRQFVTTQHWSTRMDSFVVHPLDPRQLHVAYPLIRQTAPTVDLGGWRRFAKRAADPRSARKRGVIVAHRSGNPHPSGLFCYVKDVDLSYGSVLSASHLVVLDMFDPERVYAALVDAFEALGRELGCKMTRCAPTCGGDAVVQCFLEAGYKLDGAAYCKPVAQPPSH